MQMFYRNVEFHSKLEPLDYGSVALCQRHLPILHSTGIRPWQIMLFVLPIILVDYSQEASLLFQFGVPIIEVSLLFQKLC